MKINIGPYPKRSDGKRIVNIEIHKYDAWSADHTLALVIAPVLKMLKTQKIGSPHVDDEDVPLCLRSTSVPPPKEVGWSDDNWHKRWEWALDEMIFAFDEITHGRALKKHDENGEFVEYRHENDPHLQRVKNGLNLFAKYYFCLWD